MAKYNYISERPMMAEPAGGRSFEDLVQKVRKKKQSLLIRKTILITTLVAVGLFSFSVLLLTNPEPENLEASSDSQPIVSQAGDTSTINREPLDEISTDSIPTARKEKMEVDIEERKKTVEESNPVEDYKIEESFATESEIVKAKPELGMQHLLEYFDSQVIYSDLLIENSVEGKVIIDFTITREGKVDSIAVTKSLHPVLDSIAVSAVRNMPAWNPMLVDGESEDSRHSIPLNFRPKKN